ncbi:MAG: glycine hydroxymethyltransferase [Verrucomicrobia bacterium]|nr:glycine hydroxymethyltransferase [Verrucomicrobiota bacterium]
MAKGYLQRYFEQTSDVDRSTAAIAFLAGLDHIEASSPEVARRIVQELKDQRSNIKLIASENYSSLAVQLAMGNLLTDKYAEGYPHHRFYAGCENIDAIEEMAANELRSLFGCDHAYVQPHSGADANMVAMWSVLVHRFEDKEVQRLGKKSIDELTPEEYERARQLVLSQKMMGLGLGSGGHLTHGYRRNISSKIMQAVAYDVDPKTGLLDYGALQSQVKREKPALLMVGYSAYPRLINFAKMREIADSVGAVMMTDMAHFAGLVAGKVFQGDYNPIPFSHIVTSTTHKTLRGPRGGLVMCQAEFKEVVDRGCPLVLGGPLPHVIAAKAIAFKEANTAEFREYAHQVVKNARALASYLVSRGAAVLTQGTDNHLMVIDVMQSYGLTGRQAEVALREAGLTVNRNAIPFDPNGAWYTSGIRIGTPATTTLGMKEGEMEKIAFMIHDLLKGCKKGQTRSQVVIDPQVRARVQIEAKDLLGRFPLYPELIIE